MPNVAASEDAGSSILDLLSLHKGRVGPICLRSIDL
jgi:hypothetical protein